MTNGVSSDVSSGVSWEQHRGVTDALSRYSFVVDAAAWERLDTVFTADAVLDAQYEVARGYERIRGYLAGFDPGRVHVVLNTIVEAAGPAAARAWSRFLVLQPDGVLVAGDYADELVDTADGWRIRERRISLRGRRDNAPDGEPWRVEPGPFGVPH